MSVDTETIREKSEVQAERYQQMQDYEDEERLLYLFCLLTDVVYDVCHYDRTVKKC